MPDERVAPDFALLWHDVAHAMAAQVDRGREHLLTEDVLRFTTIDALTTQGVEPERLAVEYGLPDRGKVDLVVDAPPSIAIEFKYPRDSRTGISPDTMTTGELLKDFYRLGDLRQVPERWAVLLLNDRLRGHLERRTDCRWSFEAGSILTFDPDGHARLPATAGGSLRRWAQATVQARCEGAHQFGRLRLAAYRVGGQSF